MTKKIPVGFWVGLFFACMLFSYIISGAIYKGYSQNLTEGILYVIQHPFENYYNQYTKVAALIAAIFYLFIAAYYLNSIGNYAFGREHGSAVWGNVEKINKKLSNKKKPYNNKILSENLRMDLNTHRIRLNLNLLAIGGAGAGKSAFLVSPNLWQCNSSFIITDPKGELLRRNAMYLKSQGYTIKVINLVEMEKSDCYNPFHYIRNEIDVVKLITNLIANTTPKNSRSGDPFWDSATCS